MKKIIIVNNNMKVGGVQKSLHNLLWELGDSYEVTLCLFRAVGPYMDLLPPWVKVISCRSLFRYLGVSYGDCLGWQKLVRGVLALICKVCGREAVLKLLLASQRTLPETYDCAISFLHNGRNRSFYGGVQEFVLHRVKAKRKVAFLHCDYRSCGGDYAANNRNLARFDWIAACSDGCRSAFLEVLPELEEKCVTVRNCHRYGQIRELADREPITYDSACRNVVMVSRLSHEKGIERALTAVQQAALAGVPVTLHLVGGGGQEARLRKLAQDLNIGAHVRFYGEQSNPYRYVKHADLLLLTSYHEAAPMVIEEAACLGVPVLTTQTTSSTDMVTAAGLGWVCGNDQQQISSTLLEILMDAEFLARKKQALTCKQADNQEALQQFRNVIGE